MDTPWLNGQALSDRERQRNAQQADQGVSQHLCSPNERASRAVSIANAVRMPRARHEPEKCQRPQQACFSAMATWQAIPTTMRALPVIPDNTASAGRRIAGNGGCSLPITSSICIDDSTSLHTSITREEK